jgi:septum formation protein
MIILATSSPYRRDAFRLLGLNFTVDPGAVSEDFPGRPTTPAALVRLLSRLKAEDVARRHGQGIVIGFDTVGWHRRSILEKPSSREEAFQRLRDLSGNAHTLYTGTCMLDVGTGRCLSEVTKTKIVMRRLEESEIRNYLDQDPGFNSFALGYCPFHHSSASFIKRVEGSYCNLLKGIPLEIIGGMLARLG